MKDNAGLPLVPEFFYVPRDKVHSDHFVVAFCLISNFSVAHGCKVGLLWGVITTR